uniref:PNPLA domain-containing protein n=1 Tax=viral metagenome TaxID=1070528 RepID=A0A6C0LTF4_9ZZZZ
MQLTITMRNKLETLKNAFFIEGGGTRGIYALGVIEYLFMKNPYFQFSDTKIFGGTSVGSYVAAALSLGFDISNIKLFTNEIDISNLIESYYKFPLIMYRFCKYGYLFNDNIRQKIVRQILEIKLDQIRSDLNMPNLKAIELTFGNLKTLIKSKPNTYKHLIMNSVDLSINRQIFFSTLDSNADEISLYDGLLASSAIPFVFQSTKLYRYPDGKYGYHKTLNATLDNMVDGGLSMNNTFNYVLLHPDIFTGYTFWYLKFTNDISYTPTEGIISEIKQIINFLLDSYSDINMDMIYDKYFVNIMNLHLSVGGLTIYNREQITNIVTSIFNECVNYTYKFTNK